MQCGITAYSLNIIYSLVGSYRLSSRLKPRLLLLPYYYVYVCLSVDLYCLSSDIDLQSLLYYRLWLRVRLRGI